MPREISVRWKFHGDGEHKPADYPEVKDLKSPRVIKIKGLLFLLIAILASAQILALHPDWHTAILLACAIWGACRFYYFAPNETSPEVLKISLISRGDGRFEGTFKHPVLPKNPTIKFRGVQQQTVVGGTGPNKAFGLFTTPADAGSFTFTPQ